MGFRQDHDEFKDGESWGKFLKFTVDKNEPDLNKAHILWTAQDAGARAQAAEERADKLEKDAKDAKAGDDESPPSPTGKGAVGITTDFKASKDGSYDGARAAFLGMATGLLTDD